MLECVVLDEGNSISQKHIRIILKSSLFFFVFFLKSCYVMLGIYDVIFKCLSTLLLTNIRFFSSYNIPLRSVNIIIWTASSEFGTYRLFEQRRFRRACASAQSRQNLRCSLIQAVNEEELSDRKPDPWPLWMARYAQLKFVLTECSKTQIRLTGLICWWSHRTFRNAFNASRRLAICRNRTSDILVLLIFPVDDY